MPVGRRELSGGWLCINQIQTPIFIRINQKFRSALSLTICMQTWRRGLHSAAGDVHLECAVHNKTSSRHKTEQSCFKTSTDEALCGHSASVYIQSFSDSIY